jgi:hypothetical protein
VSEGARFRVTSTLYKITRTCIEKHHDSFGMYFRENAEFLTDSECVKIFFPAKSKPTMIRGRSAWAAHRFDTQRPFSSPYHSE